MFTGIIEVTGTINSLESNNNNLSFWVNSPISNELKPDQSVSHNGVCLTVEAVRDGMHKVTAIPETLSKTNLSQWKTGTTVNLERCMQLNGRLDGHIVQGHVDCTATCIAISEANGGKQFSFRYPAEHAALVIEKGSVTIDGISLTLFDITSDSFAVAIIPYTFEHTNISALKKGDQVNIEFDVIGKYVNRITQTRQPT